jgi:hypothetical protein
MRISDFSMNEAPAYHGSDHTFDEFSVAHIGTGHGMQRFGWGIYLTDSKEVARRYKSAKGIIYHVDMPSLDTMLDWSLPISQQSSRVQSAIKRMNYEKIRQKAIDGEYIAGYGENYTTDTGEDVYNVMCSMLPMPKDFSGTGGRDDQKKVSLRMLRAGITGVKHPDPVSGDKHTNYVIFDPSRIKIERTTKS